LKCRGRRFVIGFDSSDHKEKAEDHEKKNSGREVSFHCFVGGLEEIQGRLLRARDEKTGQFGMDATLIFIHESGAILTDEI